MQPISANLQPSTSETHPIHVDFLSGTVVQFPGRLGMTIAPGKQHQGGHFLWHRDLDTDLTRLRNFYHTDVLVTLVEAEEFIHLQTPNLLLDVKAHGMESCWLPIRDFGTPSSMQGLIELVNTILAEVGLGKTVVIHCKAGLGRTGLVAAACLVALGYSPTAAFAEVRYARPGTVETAGQEAYVDEFAVAWAECHTADV